MKGYPNWFSPFFISAVLGVLFFTGALLAPTTLHLRLEWDTNWYMSGEPRVIVTALHALFSLITVAMIGALASIHMRQEWKKGNNRKSGIILVGSLIFLSVTGLGIYYFGNAKLSIAASLGHLAVGLLLLAIYLWHIFVFKKSKKRN